MFISSFFQGFKLLQDLHPGSQQGLHQALQRAFGGGILPIQTYQGMEGALRERMFTVGI